MGLVPTRWFLDASKDAGTARIGRIKMDRGSHWRWLGRASGRKCHPGGGHLRISDPPEV